MAEWIVYGITWVGGKVASNVYDKYVNGNTSEETQQEILERTKRLEKQVSKLAEKLNSEDTTEQPKININSQQKNNIEEAINTPINFKQPEKIQTINNSSQTGSVNKKSSFEITAQELVDRLAEIPILESFADSRTQV